MIHEFLAALLDIVLLSENAIVSLSRRLSRQNAQIRSLQRRVRYLERRLPN